MSLSNYVPKIKSSDDVLIDFEQANEMEDIKDEKPAFNKTSNFFTKQPSGGFGGYLTKKQNKSSGFDSRN